jgi:tRNA(Arg) A34 adenosine deaminase TadA
VITSADEKLLLAAIEVAASARENGNHPFGALLAAPDGSVVERAGNTVVTGNDATGHAETNLVRKASARFGRTELNAYTLYTSTEPCAMCSGAIYWAGIGRVVYALSEEALYVITGVNPENPTMMLPCREVFARGQGMTLVSGPAPALDTQAKAVHAGFWS